MRNVPFLLPEDKPRVDRIIKGNFSSFGFQITKSRTHIRNHFSIVFFSRLELIDGGFLPDASIINKQNATKTEIPNAMSKDKQTLGGSYKKLSFLCSWYAHRSFLQANRTY